MQKEVTKSWALFIGIGTMMIAHGLQLQVMGIRSVIENFSVITTGLFMSGYYIGYFVGSKTTPTLVSKVGHIRVFAAFASLASLSALLISSLETDLEDSKTKSTAETLGVGTLIAIPVSLPFISG